MTLCISFADPIGAISRWYADSIGRQRVFGMRPQLSIPDLGREVFATNLRRLRHEKGLSQDDLAYEAEVSRSYPSQLEKGTYFASLKYCVTASIAAQAQLHPLGLVGVRSTTHQAQVSVYLADMLMPVGTPGFMLRDIQLSELLLANPSFDGLLGRDLISQGHLYLNGIARTFTLTF